MKPSKLNRPQRPSSYLQTQLPRHADFQAKTTRYRPVNNHQKEGVSANQLKFEPKTQTIEDKKQLFQNETLAAHTPLMIFGKIKAKPIKNHAGLYITNDGQVITHEQEIKKSYQDKNGYIIVYLKPNSKPIYVHRLVAHAFVVNPDPKNKKYVDHINEVKNDNRANNLRWVTPRENWQAWARNHPQSAQRYIIKLKSKTKVNQTTKTTRTKN